MSGGACSAKAKSRRSALELESVFTVCWACGVVVFIFVIGGVDLVSSLRIRESSKPSVSPCFCGVIPEAGNSNALGLVGSKVASLPPNSSNRFLISSGVYFLPLLPGIPAPAQSPCVVDFGKAQSGSGGLVSAVDSGGSWIHRFHDD